MNSKCPKCGSDNTGCRPEITNDCIGHPELFIECYDCGNSGTATFTPTEIEWDEGGLE
jgi:hypothetical protein